MSNISVGQIWEINTDDFHATIDLRRIKIDRNAKIHLKKGEKIEIRHPFAWNYRT